MKIFFKRLLAGLGIGAGAAIPGVSGAAVALIFHVYEDIIEAVNHFRKKFGWAIKVLIPILIGIIIAVLVCIKLFSLAFEYLMFALICIFAGFLVGSFPSIQNNVKDVKPTKKLIITAVIAGLFVVALGVLSVCFGDKINIHATFEAMPVWLYFLLIPVGLIAAVALTVPGLSGSLILLIIGFYRPLMDFASKWGGELLKGNFTNFGKLIGMIGCFAIGCLLGIIIVSKIMSKLLAKHHDITYFAIIGFIIGSIFVLFFNYDIFNYYLVWGGNVIETIHPCLPIYIEIPLGILLFIGCTVGSYFLTKKTNKKV